MSEFGREYHQFNRSESSTYSNTQINNQDSNSSASSSDTEIPLNTPNRLHYVVETPVSDKAFPGNTHKGIEFTHIRYTACTCDPDDFEKDGYDLRQTKKERKIEVFIVITMYNEDAELFARTFHGVMENICNKFLDRWKKHGWKKIVVCIVSDGRKQIHKDTLTYLTALGVYRKGLAVAKVDGKGVTAHIYEYTSQICYDPDRNMEKIKTQTPIQILFCLKEKNAKKINSHRWFFNAFSRVLNPNVCILLDAGTKPGKNSIYRLWKTFDSHPNVGGACGEIVAMKGKKGKSLLNPLVAAQNFEYKISNILDKPLESVFGYITVLPGAFSAYRYAALKNDEVKDKESVIEVGPLASYFLGEKHHQKPEKSGLEKKKNAGLFEANMYLAEDRILCFELVTKRNSNWLLHYVESASAETDVPDDIVELISQRRRWLNGSFFAGLYAILHTFDIHRSSHSTGRKFALLFETLYLTYNVTFSWFALGNLYLVFYILGSLLATNEMVTEGLWSLNTGAIIFKVLRYIYIGLIIFQFSLALGNKPRSAKWAYIASTVFFSFLMFYMLFAAGWITYKGIKASQEDIASPNVTRNIIISLLATYGLYFVSSLLFFDPGHMFHSIVQYMLLVPLYVNILNVYAFCNVHDVSWGTKGEPKAEKLPEKMTENMTKSDGSATVEVDKEYEKAVLSLKKDKHKTDDEIKELQKESDAMYRTYLVSAWMISNGMLIVLVTNLSPSLESLNSTQKSNDNYFVFVFWSIVCLAAVRFFGSLFYLIKRKRKKKGRKK